MNNYVLPRVTAEHAARRPEDLRNQSITKISRDADKKKFEEETFAVLGLQRIPDPELEKVRDGLRSLAIDFGYPEVAKSATKFDILAAIYLHENVPAPRGELLRNEVWQYFTCSLVPDVVCWRWRKGDEQPHPDRFSGGVRNSLGRLWRRADVLRDERLRDPWTLVKMLSEDNVTTIIERPRVARNRLVVREASRAFLLRRELAKEMDIKSPVQEYLRQVMLRITRRGAHLAFPTLSHEDLVESIASIADSVLAAFDVKPLEERRLLTEKPELEIARVPELTGRGAAGIVRNAGARRS